MAKYSRQFGLFFILCAACSGDDAARPTAVQHDQGARDVDQPDTQIARDAGRDTELDTGADVLPTQSRCVVTAQEIRCPYETLTLSTGFSGLVPRDVHYQVPSSPPPPNGYPVVLLFQGSLFSAELSFEASTDDPFGAIHQTRMVAELLDHGYAVLAPETHVNGSTYWDTNVPPYSLDWDLAPDNRFMLDIFDAIDSGEFGVLDRGTMFATGISSGGYMTSRMAVSYEGEFRALAINAGSYATCSGALCAVPALPPTHPPTLFVHGEDDNVVPLDTAVAYHEALQPITDTELLTEPGGHEYLPVAPDAIVGWFEARR